MLKSLGRNPKERELKSPPMLQMAFEQVRSLRQSEKLENMIRLHEKSLSHILEVESEENMKIYQMSLDDLSMPMDWGFKDNIPFVGWQELKDLIAKNSPRRPIMKKFNAAEPWDCADHFVEKEACPVCKIPLPKDTLFCGYCGQRIDRKGCFSTATLRRTR